MKVLFDEQPIAATRATLGGALAAGRAAAEQRGRVIVEVSVDGQTLSEEELGAADEAPRPGAEVRLVSAEPRALVRVTLQEVAELLPACERDQHAAAEMIQAGKLQEALPKLSQALVAWENVRSAVENGAALVGLDVAKVRLAAEAGKQEEAIAESIAALARELEQIKRCLRAQDWSGLSDSLAFEMQDQARHWRGLLSALADRVGRA